MSMKIQIPHNITMQLVRSEQRWELFKEYLRRYMGIDLLQWQEEEIWNMIRQNTYLINWGRGMSKTILLCILSVFNALLGLKTCYCVPRTDELGQPKQYFNQCPFVDINPYKRDEDKSFNIEKAIWYKVLGRPAIKLTNVDDKGANLSSGRFNYVIYDECALLMYYKLEVELLNKGEGMLRSMNYPHTIFASTPLLGSHFYTLYEHLPHPQKSWRNFENTSQNFLTNSPEKRAKLEDERHRASDMGVLFAWETENLAIPHTAHGAAFKNIKPMELAHMPFHSPTHAGFDFHGWKTGHIWVAFYYRPATEPTTIYVMREGAEIYEEDATADESMQFLRYDSYFHALKLRGESGGMINDPYIKAGREWGMESVSIQGKKKNELEANILNYTIYVDKTQCPNTWRDLTEAEWKDPNKFILHKEPSGQKFRNHYLDALSNALPLARTDGIWVPNRQLREGKGVVEQERKRAHQQSSIYF